MPPILPPTPDGERLPKPKPATQAATGGAKLVEQALSTAGQGLNNAGYTAQVINQLAQQSSGGGSSGPVGAIATAPPPPSIYDQYSPLVGGLFDTAASQMQQQVDLSKKGMEDLRGQLAGSYDTVKGDVNKIYGSALEQLLAQANAYGAPNVDAVGTLQEQQRRLGALSDTLKASSLNSYDWTKQARESQLADFVSMMQGRKATSLAELLSLSAAMSGAGGGGGGGYGGGGGGSSTSDILGKFTRTVEDAMKEAATEDQKQLNVGDLDFYKSLGGDKTYEGRLWDQAYQTSGLSVPNTVKLLRDMAGTAQSQANIYRNQYSSKKGRTTYKGTSTPIGNWSRILDKAKSVAYGAKAKTASSLASRTVPLAGGYGGAAVTRSTKSTSTSGDKTSAKRTWTGSWPYG